MSELLDYLFSVDFKRGDVVLFVDADTSKPLVLVRGTTVVPAVPGNLTGLRGAVLTVVLARFEEVAPEILDVRSCLVRSDVTFLADCF